MQEKRARIKQFSLRSSKRRAEVGRKREDWSLALVLVLSELIRRGLALASVLFIQVKRSHARVLVLFNCIKVY